SHDMKKYPFFLLLLGMYPSLALLTWNFREVDAIVVIRPFLFSIAFALLLVAISSLLLKSWSKALLISTVIIIFFFSFGHISLMVEGSALGAVLGKFGQWNSVFLLAFAF